MPFLALPLAARALRREEDGALRAASFSAPLLLLAFPFVCALDDRAAAVLPFFGTLFLLAAAVSAVSAACGIRGLSAATFPALFLSAAAWGAKHLDAQTWTEGLALFVATGAFYVLAPLVADAARRPLSPPDGPERLLALGGHLLLLGAAATGRLAGLAPVPFAAALGAACVAAFAGAWLPPAPALQAGSLLVGAIAPLVAAASIPSSMTAGTTTVAVAAALLALFGVATGLAAAREGRGEASAWGGGAGAAVLVGTLTVALVGTRADALPLAVPILAQLLIAACGLALARGTGTAGSASSPGTAPVAALDASAVPLRPAPGPHRRTCAPHHGRRRGGGHRRRGRCG